MEQELGVVEVKVKLPGTMFGRYEDVIFSYDVLLVKKESDVLFVFRPQTKYMSYTLPFFVTTGEEIPNIKRGIVVELPRVLIQIPVWDLEAKMETTPLPDVVREMAEEIVAPVILTRFIVV